MQAYVDKGRVKPLLDTVPLFAVMTEDLGVRGAYKCAMMVSRTLKVPILLLKCEPNKTHVSHCRILRGFAPMVTRRNTLEKAMTAKAKHFSLWQQWQLLRLRLAQ